MKRPPFTPSHYHKLLAKQLAKASPGLMSNPEFIEFIEKVNTHYSLLDRELNISNHAFEISEMEYLEVTSALKQRDVERGEMVKQILEAILALSPESFDGQEQPLNDLNTVVKTLQQQIQKSKALENQLITAKTIAEKAQERESEFLANMSHEIRTPLNGIVGMTDLFAETELSAEQSKYISIIKSSSELLLSLINDILDLSKLDAGKMELNYSPFSLCEEITKCLQPLGLKAFQKGIELIFQFDRSMPTAYVGDLLRIQQIILNLVGNAIKFTEKGEVVFRIDVLAVNKSKATLSFSVSDTGIGIPKEKLVKIFEDFTQADNSTTRKYGGTGLGLAIAKRLVEKMGGKIWVDSVLGQGSTFNFVLELEMQINESGNRRDNRQLLMGSDVLVVEDNEIASEYIQYILKNFNMQPVAVRTGEEALQQLEARANEKNPFSMLFLDINLAGEMDGFDVVRQIRSARSIKKTKVIVTSMSQRPEDIKEFKKLGVVDYFTKPFCISKFLDCIRSVVTHKSDTESTKISEDKFEYKNEMEEGVPKMPALKILLVEDNPVNQEVTSNMLALHGHRVALAVNGQVAVDMYRKEKYDLVLMDVQMPLMNGYEATKEIRELEKVSKNHTPIIGLTANAMRGDREKCLKAGMDEYLSKPVYLRNLSNAILKIAGEKAMTEEIETTTSLPIVNRDRLFEKIGTGRTQLDRLQQIFVEELSDLYSRMDIGLQTKDAQVLRNVCHDFKGMLLTMEMEDASKTLDIIHEAARNRKFGQMKKNLPLLKEKIAQALQFLEALKINIEI